MSTHNVPFSNKKKITLDYPKSAAMGIFPWDSRTSPSSRGKRANRAIEVLLY